MRISDWSSDVCSSDLFAQRPAAEVRDHLPRTQPCRLAAQRLEVGGGPFIGFNVARELLVDTGAADLDGDRAAVGGHRAVDLGDRGGADRYGIECGREDFERVRKSVV